MSNFHFANWEDIKDKDCQVFYPMYQVKIPGEKTYIHELIFDEEKLVKTPYGIIGSPIFSNPQFLRVFIYSEDIINYIKSDYFTNAFTFDLKNDKSFLCETDFNLHLNKKEILNNRKSIISFGKTSSTLKALFQQLAFKLMHVTISNFYYSKEGIANFKNSIFYETLNGLHQGSDIYYFGDDLDSVKSVMNNKIAYEFLIKECISSLTIKIDLENHPNLSNKIISNAPDDSCAEIHIGMATYLNYKYKSLS